jgi:hypothetical protein
MNCFFYLWTGRWKQQVSLIHSYMSAKLHRVISHKTVILIFMCHVLVAFSVNNICLSVLFIYFLWHAIVHGLFPPVTSDWGSHNLHIHSTTFILPASLHTGKILYSGFPPSWHTSHLSEDGASICSQTAKCPKKAVYLSLYMYFSLVCRGKVELYYPPKYFSCF